MKIFCGLRLFSGFETSIQGKVWQPTGAPTIYKLIEALDATHDPVFTLVCKQTYVALGGGDQAVSLEGLRHPLHILARRWKPGSSMREHLNEAAQSWALYRACKRAKPDLAYFTSANALAAALVARYTHIPVVLRIMGVYPAQRQFLHGKRPAHRAFRWAYRSPFACVVCTQDGSGGEQWMNQAFPQSTPRRLLLNGVNLPAELPPMAKELAALPADRTIVAAVGKLESDKGAMEFLTGFLDAWQTDPQGLHGLVIGTGSLSQAMRCLVTERGAGQAVTFIDRLPHAQIPWVHRCAHIYVSLNRLGNLSNANLEAMRAGTCMIIPRSQPDTGVDLATDELVPDDAAARIPHTDDTLALAQEILALHRDPKRRNALRENMAQAAASFIPTWDQRVETEMALLRSLAHGAEKAYPATSEG